MPGQKQSAADVAAVVGYLVPVDSATRAAAPPTSPSRRARSATSPPKSQTGSATTRPISALTKRNPRQPRRQRIRWGYEIEAQHRARARDVWLVRRRVLPLRRTLGQWELPHHRCRQHRDRTRCRHLPGSIQQRTPTRSVSVLCLEQAQQQLGRCHGLALVVLRESPRDR